MSDQSSNNTFMGYGTPLYPAYGQQTTDQQQFIPQQTPMYPQYSQQQPQQQFYNHTQPMQPGMVPYTPQYEQYTPITQIPTPQQAFLPTRQQFIPTPDQPLSFPPIPIPQEVIQHPLPQNTNPPRAIPLPPQSQPILPPTDSTIAVPLKNQTAPEYYDSLPPPDTTTKGNEIDTTEGGQVTPQLLDDFDTATAGCNAEAKPFYPNQIVPFDQQDKQIRLILDRVMQTQSRASQPKHACNYCGISHIDAVGQCAQCHKWFCNQQGETTTSHLLTHLISSHHRSFRHHPQSANNDIDLECYFCNTRNVFLLGTINTKEDNIVAIVCRSPCLLSPRLKQQNFDLSSWTSIIDKKRFIEWLLPTPPEEQLTNAAPITSGIINKLEELWRTEPTATVEDLFNRTQAFSHIQQTPDSFGNSLHYARVFHDLVNIEAETDRLVKSQQCQEGLSVRWATSNQNGSGEVEVVSLDEVVSFHAYDLDASESLLNNKRLFAVFTIFQEEETSLKIVLGDELILMFGNEHDATGKGFWVGTGYAVKVSLSGQIVMALDNKCIATAPTKEEHGFKVLCAWKAVTYDRMHTALRRFSHLTYLVDPDLYNEHLLQVQAKRTETQKKGKKEKKKKYSKQQPQQATVYKGETADSFDDPHFPMNYESIIPCMSTNLYHQLLGLTHTDEGVSINTIPSDLDKLENLPALNRFQQDAILTSLRSTLSLLQGPPGAGKTLTSAYLVHALLQALKRESDEYKNTHGEAKKIHPILVCAPSNIAVDHLAEKLHMAGLKVVRVASRSRQALQSTVDFLSLHVLVGQLAQRAKRGRFYDLHQLVTNNPLSLTTAQRIEYRLLTHNVSLAILNNADVICTTCISVGDNHLFEEFKFEHVLIDEATQCPEPEILLPMTHGARQVFLIGDHCQLGPVVLSKHAAKAGYNRSLFERLLLRGHVPKMLQIQYRMHPEIAKFPADTFYDGNLSNGLKAKDRQFEHPVFPWPNPGVPMTFIASTGSIEEYSASGTSYINRYEVSIIEKCVIYLIQHGIQLGQIGVITPYEGQRLHLMSALSRESSPLVKLLQSSGRIGGTNSAQPTLLDSLTALNSLEIASVDSFQGREKDIILFTCVRSNEHSDLGFLCDPRRLNVALTRAKYGMIMTGNPKVLLKHPLWHALLCHFKLQKCFMEGMDVEHLKPCQIVLPPSRTFLNARNIRIPLGFDPKTSFGMKNVLDFNKQHKKVFGDRHHHNNHSRDNIDDDNDESRQLQQQQSWRGNGLYYSTVDQVDESPDVNSDNYYSTYINYPNADDGEDVGR